MESFNFNPQNGFKDTTVFPNPSNADETREQLNKLHNQTRDFINNKIKPAIDSLQNTDVGNLTSSDGSVTITKSGGTTNLKVSVTGSTVVTKAYVDEQVRSINILEKAYPVGSIYLSVNETNPSTLIGGTWVRIKDKFLLASGDTYANGSTGGEATHKLTESELPSHSHSIPALSGTAESSGSHSHTVYGTYGGANDNGKPVTERGGYQNSSFSTAGAGSHTHSVTTLASNTDSTGSGTAHNNMPPYLAITVWKRTA